MKTARFVVEVKWEEEEEAEGLDAEHIRIELQEILNECLPLYTTVAEQEETTK